MECNAPGKPENSVWISRQDSGDGYVAKPTEGEARQYPNFDALLADLSAGKDPFAGCSAIRLAYKHYVVSGTFVLTLGPDGRVANVNRISRG